MRFEIDVDIPEGFEPTGEYRKPEVGEWCMASSTGIPLLARVPVERHLIILRRKRPEFVTLENVPTAWVERAIGGAFVQRDEWMTRDDLGLIESCRDALTRLDRGDA